MKRTKVKTSGADNLLPSLVASAFKSEAQTHNRRIDHPVRHAFKRIAVSNLNSPDTSIPLPAHVQGEKWVTACLEPQLDGCVPKQVAELFEVARGAMIYGLFFHPLMSLAREQCYRVLEAGARTRCSQLALLPKKSAEEKGFQDTSFAKILEALKMSGKILEADSKLWDGMRKLRNCYSHPTSQRIGSPALALGVVQKTCELINRLFR